MFRTLLKKIKKIFLFFLILGVIFLMVITIINLRDFFRDDGKTTIIIDSGTGSDPGQLFAITRALIASELEVAGLVSSQWNSNPDAENNSVQISHRFHITILEIMNKTYIPAILGENDAFSLKHTAKHESSDAASFYIKQAHNAKKDEKINIVALGAATNLAYAIQKDPSIVKNIRIYFNGLQFDQKAKVWNKNETNVRYDLDAVDLLLNTTGLEIHVLPANLSSKLIFTQEELVKTMQGRGDPWNFLLTRLNMSDPGTMQLEMKELALIESLINPKFIKVSQVNSPPENSRGKVNLFTYLNITMMRLSFHNAVKKEISKTIPTP